MTSQLNFKLIRNFMRKNLLLVSVLLAVILGFSVGILANKKVQNSIKPTPKELVVFISFPGEIFLRMLQLLVLPLVISSVISSLAILDKKSAAKLGARFAGYTVVTTLLAVIVGIILASLIIDPKEKKFKENQKSSTDLNAVHSVLDMIRNLIPENIVEACFSSVATKYKRETTSFKFVNYSSSNLQSARNISDVLKNKIINPWRKSRNSIEIIEENNTIYDFDGLENYNSTNLVGILAISVVFGSILSILDEEGKPIVQLVTCLFKVMMKMVDLFIWLTPIGILSIIAGNLAGMKDIKGSIESLGLYIAAMIIGSLIHGIIVLPSIYFVLLRRNPFQLLTRMSQALLTAFGTASSSSTIPIALSDLETKHKVDRRISQFIIPVGTTINKGGSGMYNAVSAIYIAQTQHGFTLGIGSAIILCLASTIGSVVAAPVPGAAPIVSKTIVLQAIGIRSADISLILAVDWLVSRISTPLNVWGNCVGCVIIEHLSGDDLSETEKKPGNGCSLGEIVQGENNDAMEISEADDITEISDDMV